MKPIWMTYRLFENQDLKEATKNANQGAFPFTAH